MFISIVIPLFNKEAYIEKAITSVLNQTHQDFEILVIDDGSTDDSCHVIENMRNEKIRIMRQSNQGVSAARNRGIREARSDYVAFLDADDFWDTSFLFTIDKLINNYSDCGLWATCYRIVKNNKVIIPNVKGITCNDGIIGNYFKVRVLGDCPFHSSSVCIHRNVFREIGYFIEGEQMGEDQEMWARIALHHKIAFSNDILCNYVLVEKSACKTNIVDQNVIHIAKMQSWLEQGNIPDDLVKDIVLLIRKELLMVVRANITNRNTKKARSILRDDRLRESFTWRIVLLLASFAPNVMIRHLRRM